MAGNGYKLKNGTKRGFSLLESMVALTILLVGIGGVAAAFQNHISKSVAARNQSQAAIIAANVYTELADTNPEDWDSSALEAFYIYDYEGHQVDDIGDAYYQVTINSTKESGWWNIAVGVTWKGWRAEEAKTGYANESTDFAYVLEGSISPLYGDEGD
jgi:prepilin-type N-terminal cleavage/methylation domain-containing protein